MDDMSAREAESAEDVLKDGRKRWTTPRISDLPRLTELTLQTGNPIIGSGGTGGGGSSVF